MNNAVNEVFPQYFNHQKRHYMRPECKSESDKGTQHVASQNTEIIVINQSFAQNYMGLHTLNVLSVRRHCNPYELFL